MSINPRLSSHRVNVQELVKLVDAIRQSEGMSWAEISREMGLNYSFFPRLKREKHVSMSADSFVSILVWLDTWRVVDVPHNMIRERTEEETLA